jgi:hypothetical protein
VHQQDAVDSRPGLTFMAEYGADIPLWHGPGSDRTSCLDAEELAALGVSDGLIKRLQAWQEDWEHDPRKTWNRKDKVVAGIPLGVRLARQLQAELPRHRIFLPGPDPIPVDEWPA